MPDLHKVITQVKQWNIIMLNPDVKTAEISPDHLNFQVYRDDRVKRQGGVILLAISRSLAPPKVKLQCCLGKNISKEHKGYLHLIIL